MCVRVVMEGAGWAGCVCLNVCVCVSVCVRERACGPGGEQGMCAYLIQGGGLCSSDEAKLDI